MKILLLNTSKNKNNMYISSVLKQITFSLSFKIVHLEQQMNNFFRRKLVEMIAMKSISSPPNLHKIFTLEVREMIIKNFKSTYVIHNNITTIFILIFLVKFCRDDQLVREIISTKFRQKIHVFFP